MIDLPAHFATFEDRLLKVITRTGSSPLTPEGKRLAILDMVPSSMERELENQVHLFKTYEDLTAHALDVAARQVGKGHDVHNLESDTIEFLDDSGELMKLERQNCKWVSSKPKTTFMKFPKNSC